MRAADAARNGGIGLEAGRRDLFPARDAKAELALFHSLQRRLDALYLVEMFALGRLGHGLPLHRVDARKPPDRHLVERHRPPIVRRRLYKRAQFVKAAFKLFAVFALIHPSSVLSSAGYVTRMSGDSHPSLLLPSDD